MYSAGRRAGGEAEPGAGVPGRDSEFTKTGARRQSKEAETHQLGQEEEGNHASSIPGRYVLNRKWYTPAYLIKRPSLLAKDYTVDTFHRKCVEKKMHKKVNK